MSDKLQSLAAEALRRINNFLVTTPGVRAILDELVRAGYQEGMERSAEWVNLHADILPDKDSPVHKALKEVERLLIRRATLDAEMEAPK